jgi:hypothetical protein
MQNKPNSPIVQLNLTPFITMHYTISTCLTKVKNKPNTNPIKPNFGPILPVANPNKPNFCFLSLAVLTNRSATILPVLTYKPLIKQFLLTNVDLIALKDAIDRMTNIYVREDIFSKVIS